MNTSLAATAWAWTYYVSFVVLAIFVVINLFIAIVINNLEAAKRDEHVPTDSQSETLAARFAGIREQLEAIESALRDQSQEGRERAHARTSSLSKPVSRSR
jgi:voltage-gated sodium channel